jgi:hypothetical protein
LSLFITRAFAFSPVIFPRLHAACGFADPPMKTFISS